MIGGINNGNFDLKLSIAKIKLCQIKVLYSGVKKRCPKTIVHALKLLKYKQHWLNFFTFISIIGLTVLAHDRPYEIACVLARK